jgi:hypothetical protein
MDPEHVIAATHGRRASDNLQELIPSLKPQHVNQEVDSESTFRHYEPSYMFLDHADSQNSNDPSWLSPIPPHDLDQDQQHPVEEILPSPVNPP